MQVCVLAGFVGAVNIKVCTSGAFFWLSGRETPPFSGPLIFMTCTFCKRLLLRLMEHPVEIHKLQVPLAAGGGLRVKTPAIKRQHAEMFCQRL